MEQKLLPYLQVLTKMEAYCAYQERCHYDVRQKLWEFKLDTNEQEQLVTALIQSGFLNEERFVRAFVRGKARIKKWGKVRITSELKARNIPSSLIQIGLTEIADGDWDEQLTLLADKLWEKAQKGTEWQRKKAFFDPLLRKGYDWQSIQEEWDQRHKEA